MAPELRFVFSRTYYHIFGFIPKTYLSSIAPIQQYSFTYPPGSRVCMCARMCARMRTCVCMRVCVGACSYTHKNSHIPGIECVENESGTNQQQTTERRTKREKLTKCYKQNRLKTVT